MKKLLLSVIATAIFTFAASSVAAQQNTPVKKDTTEKSKKPAMPMPDSTVPAPNTPIMGPDSPEKPVPPEKTKPRNPTLPQVPDNPPPAPAPASPVPAPQPV